MQHVSVSAVYIEWPLVCASCGNKSDCSQRITFSRITGKRVIRETVKYFDIPYCTKCERYWELVAEQAPTERALDRVQSDIKLAREYKRELPPLPGGDVVIVVISGILTCGIAAYPVYLWAANQHKERCRKVINRLPKNMKKRESLIDRLEEAERERKHLLPTTGKVYRKPVEYTDWKGTLHTFAFSNAAYADMFRNQNEKKLR